MLGQQAMIVPSDTILCGTIFVSFLTPAEISHCDQATPEFFPVNELAGLPGSKITGYDR